MLLSLLKGIKLTLISTEAFYPTTFLITPSNTDDLLSFHDVSGNLDHHRLIQIVRNDLIEQIITKDLALTPVAPAAAETNTVS